jgi:hypothetical protein
MKKNIAILSALTLLTCSSIFTSCKKDDITPPVVTMTGGDQTISLGATFTDPGASANDNKDGAISVTTTGVVDINHTGVYQITYSATDAAGNTGTAVRNVTVINDLDAMTGVYSCTLNPGPVTYTQTINASSTVNRRLIFGTFGDYYYYSGGVKTGALNTIYADVNNTGTTSPITLPSQTSIQVGNPATDRTFSGTGARVSASTFNLSYTETTPAPSSVNTTEVYVKQ